MKLFSLALALGAAYAPTATALSPNTLDVQSLILNAYKSGQSSVTIPSGTWLVPAPKYWSYSQAHLELANLKNFTVNGNGATLIYAEPRTGGMHLVNCTNVTFNSLTVDYSIPTFTQGHILNINPAAKTLDVQIDAGYLHTLTDPSYFVQANALFIYSPATRGLKVGATDVYTTSVSQLSANTFRFVLTNGAGQAAVGDLFAMRALTGPAVFVDNSSGTTLKNYTVFSGLYGTVEGGGDGGTTLEHFTVSYGPTPAGGTQPRLLSTAGDGFHSSGARRGALLDNVLIEGQGDDGVNIHGHFAKVMANSGQTLTIGTQGVNFFQPHDTIKVMDAQGNYKGSAHVLATAPVAAGFAPTVSPTTGSFTYSVYTTLTLDAAVPTVAGDMAWNQNAIGSGYIIRNSTFRNSRARGILVKADHGQILHNVIDGPSMGGILVNPEYPYYSEAGYSDDLLIQGNTIKNTGRNAPGSFNGVSINSTLPGMTHSNIQILNNVFYNNYGTDLVVSAVQKILVSNNNFAGQSRPAVAAAAANTPTPTIPLINLFNAKNVTFVGNAYAASRVAIVQGPNVGSFTSDSTIHSYEAGSAPNLIQGPIWYYQFASSGQYNYTNYNLLSAWGWWQNVARNVASGGFYSGSRLNAGSSNDVVLTFVAPTTGTATITAGNNGTSNGTIMIGPTYNSPDGVLLGIWHNSTKIWPLSSGWQALTVASPLEFGSVTMPVTAGDKIHFRTNKHNDGTFDDVRWNPVVTITTP